MGGPCVGKSSILSKLLKGVATPVYHPTVGPDLYSIAVHPHPACAVRLQLLDIPHAELTGPNIPQFVRGAWGVVFVFDIGCPKSVVALDQWTSVLRPRLPPCTKFLVLAHKSDLPEPCVPMTILRGYCASLGARCYSTTVHSETSVRTALSGFLQDVGLDVLQQLNGLSVEDEGIHRCPRGFVCDNGCTALGTSWVVQA